MTLWTIAFDATVTVSVEAETENDATGAAESMVEEAHYEVAPHKESVDLSIERIFLIRNEKTGEEIMK